MMTLRRECDVCGGQWKADLPYIPMTTLDVPPTRVGLDTFGKHIDICTTCLERVHEAIRPRPREEP